MLRFVPQVVTNQINLNTIFSNTTQPMDGTLDQEQTWDAIRQNAQAILNEDDTVWQATVIVGYITSALYLILFFWFLTYQFTSVCGCCAGEAGEKMARRECPFRKRRWFLPAWSSCSNVKCISELQRIKRAL